MREGGHDVPPAIVGQRNHQSLSLLKQYYAVFDHIRLVDNTDRAVGYQTVAIIENGRVQRIQPVSAGCATGIVRHVQLRERFVQL